MNPSKPGMASAAAPRYKLSRYVQTFAIDAERVAIAHPFYLTRSVLVADAARSIELLRERADTRLGRLTIAGTGGEQGLQARALTLR